MSELLVENQLGVPEGYKLTEVGVIPEDWEVDKIENQLFITTGKKNTQDKVVDGIYPFFVRSQQIESINTFSFTGEGVLTAGDGVGTGKVFHYINGKFDFHQRVYLMYNFNRNLDGYYFYIYFSNYFYDRIMSMTAKSSVDSVRREMIAEMLITLPPLEEQTAIATALSDVDELLSSLAALIAKKQAIKTATMQQLLSGRTRLPQFALREDGSPKGYKPSELGEIPEDWESVQLGDIVSIVKGDPLVSRDIKLGSVPVIAGGKSAIYFHNKANREGKTITISASGANAGYVSFHNSPIFASDCSTISESSRYIIEFINYLLTLNQEDIYKAQVGGAQPHIYAKDLIPMKVAIPPISEQSAIATILSDMDAELEALEKQLSKNQQIKQGMMQQLLTGKIRLLKPN